MTWAGSSKSTLLSWNVDSFDAVITLEMVITPVRQGSVKGPRIVNSDQILCYYFYLEYLPSLVEAGASY